MEYSNKHKIKETFSAIKKASQDDPEFRQNLDTVIEYLRNAHLIDDDQQETYISNLLSDILGLLNDKLKNIPTYDQLNSEQQRAIEEMLQKIIVEFVLTGKDLDSEELGELLLTALLAHFNIKSQQEKEEHDPHFQLTEKDKKRIREELVRIAIYELYKRFTPNRLAGDSVDKKFNRDLAVRGPQEAERILEKNQDTPLLHSIKEEVEKKSFADKHAERSSNKSGPGMGF